MNSFLYRNKRQASYHTPLAIRPTIKQNSKTASLKTKQKHPEDYLSQSFKNNKTCSEEEPGTDNIPGNRFHFPWECSLPEVRNLFRMLEIPRFNIYHPFDIFSSWSKLFILSPTFEQHIKSKHIW